MTSTHNGYKPSQLGHRPTHSTDPGAERAEIRLLASGAPLAATPREQQNPTTSALESGNTLTQPR